MHVSFLKVERPILVTSTRKRQLELERNIQAITMLQAVRGPRTGRGGFQTGKEGGSIKAK